MKVKILHQIPGWAYFGGEITEIADEKGAQLVAHGHAVMIPETIRELPTIKAVVHGEEVIKQKLHQNK